MYLYFISIKVLSSVDQRKINKLMPIQNKNWDQLSINKPLLPAKQHISNTLQMPISTENMFNLDKETNRRRNSWDHRQFHQNDKSFLGTFPTLNEDEPDCEECRRFRELQESSFKYQVNFII